MKTLMIWMLLFGMLVSVSSQTVSQRAEKSEISGSVFDPYGAVITQTRVTFKNKTGRFFRSMTNDQGNFQIELNEGSYSIQFAKSGFKLYTVEKYRVAFKTRMRLDVSLEVGGF